MLSRATAKPSSDLGYLSRAYLASDEDVLSGHIRGFKASAISLSFCMAQDNTCEGNL